MRLKMDIRPIGIFDSGIGGLTVLKEMKKALPGEDYIYLGDTLNFPYGEKTKEEIISFAKKNIEFLKLKNVKLIIIACGTATSQALKEMQEIFDIPIIGIITPTVRYVKELNLKKVGVIATSGTIRSGVFEKELKENIKNIEVINKACPLLASIAEEGKAKSKKSIDTIHNYMQIFKENNVDTIILGCTHYPIYDEIIKAEFKGNVNLINTGFAVAKNVKKYLKDQNMENKSEMKYSKIVITKEEQEFVKKAKNILKSGEKLDIAIIN